MKARRAHLKLIYSGTDISGEVEKHLTSYTYTDNAHGKADDISIALEDREGRWRGPWFPEKGATVAASIVTENWRHKGDTQIMPCGTFEIDDINMSGPPAKVTIKAVSTPTKSVVRQEQHNKAWEKIKLSRIAGEIAQRGNLRLIWDSRLDPQFERRDQVEQSDLQFLQSLCEDYGIGMKVVNGNLLCYNEADHENKAPSDTIIFGEPRVEKFSFRHKCRDTYKSSKVQYHDHIKDEFFEVYASGEAEGTGSELVSNQKVDNAGDARIMAQKKLRDANKRETTANISLMGDITKTACSVLTLQGFGKFDSRWFLEKVTHTVTASGGFSTKLELRIAGTAVDAPGGG